jgi:hypothetical protein
MPTWAININYNTCNLTSSASILYLNLFLQLFTGIRWSVSTFIKGPGVIQIKLLRVHKSSLTIGSWNIWKSQWIDSCLPPALAVFQLYHGGSMYPKLHIWSMPISDRILKLTLLWVISLLYWQRCPFHAKFNRNTIYFSHTHTV